MSSLSQAASSVEKRTNARYWIVVMLFIVTSFNYGDRATLSIAGSEMAKDIGLDPVGMGYVFSAFSWAYVIGQIPGGWLLDRFGSKRVYFWSIFIWSMFTLLQGFVDIFSGFGIIVALFTLRFLVGLAEAPSFPGNSRIVAAWFPAQERGTAVSIFNSAQYFATVIFAPIMGWLTHEVGWSHVFFFMGGLGIVISFIWLKVIHEPNQHPGVNQKELEYIAAGGALINMDQQNTKVKVPFSVKWGQIKQLLGSRMMIGVYIGQYCINALTYFFITWFPVYLVQARGMSILKAGFVASVPAVCGFIGGVLGGLSGVAGYFWEGHDDLGGTIAHLLGVASPWALTLCAAVLLGLGLYQYRKARTAFRSWDGEDEDVMQQAEERLSRTLLLDSLTVIVSFFFFNAGTAKLPQSSDGNTITLLVIFLVVIALATLLQQKTVDLTKKMNPEKRGSVYDMKFQERWWESCDEAERRQIGQASYKAYVTVSRFCPYCWGVLLLGNMVFHYGILPSAVVLVIWAVLSVSYTREAIRLGRRGQKTE